MITVKELINIVLDSPFYLTIPLRERKDHIQSFVTMYMRDEENDIQKDKRADFSVAGNYGQRV